MTTFATTPLNLCFVSYKQLVRCNPAVEFGKIFFCKLRVLRSKVVESLKQSFFSTIGTTYSIELSIYDLTLPYPVTL